MNTTEVDDEPPSFDHALPHIAVDPLYLHRLLLFGLLYNNLVPWCPESLDFGLNFPMGENRPPWTVQLELHYQKSHPQTWDVLAADDRIDSWFQGKVVEEQAKQFRHYGKHFMRFDKYTSNSARECSRHALDLEW
ncbi:hypothetical protein JCM10295v2_006220 [Rhodotorula toruloides]